MKPHVNDIEIMEQLPESWEAPEAIELGEAALLTLGAYGCRDDGKSCTFSSSENVDF
jgi:hypothetical protein